MTSTQTTSAPAANAVLTRIRDRARSNPRRIVLPEVDDPRVREAARILVGEGLAEPILCEGQREITEYGGWRAYLASLSPPASGNASNA